MYKEMDENGQYQMDCRLDSERDLEENVSIMITFAHRQLEARVGDNFVKNRYEGYGLLSEQFSGLAKALKEVGNGMTTFLKIMPLGDHYVQYVSDHSHLFKLRLCLAGIYDAGGV